MSIGVADTPDTREGPDDPDGLAREAVAPDGSPVAVYLALPPGPAPELIDRALAPGSSVLELGCGVGRITHPLLARGHRVVAVDESAEMLAQVSGAETLCADVYELALGRRFDGVVAASHFIDHRDPDRRRRLLDVCRQHVRDDGVVVVQRHEPGWAHDPADTDGFSGPVGVSFRLIDHRGSEFEAEVTYTLGDRSWRQRFTSAIVEDEMLEREAAFCGLRVESWLDERHAWAALRPV